MLLQLSARERTTLWICAAVASVVVAVGVTVHGLYRIFGTATPPFVIVWGPGVDVLLVVCVVVLAAFMAAVPRLLAVPRPAVFAGLTFLAALAVSLSVNAAHGGTYSWYAIFDLGPRGSFEASNEVIAGLPALSYGARFFLDRFAELAPSVPVNVAGHPPGLPLIMHWLDLGTARRLAALCDVSLAAVAPVTYALGRALALGEHRARAGALLACASPSLVLFGVTSADAVFALAGTVTAALLVSRRPGVRAAGCVALAFAALLSWLLLAVAAWAALVVWQRRGLRAAVMLAAGCAAAVAALDGALAVSVGYDAIGTLRATSDVYSNSVARERPYKFWVFGSPVAFALMAGLPVAAGLVVAVVRRTPAALALAAVVLVSAVLGFTKAEVERIWLPFVPLACVAAATVIPSRSVRVVLIALLVQALTVSLVFDTIW